MSEHQAHIHWTRRPADAFIDSCYSRGHSWEFDGGSSVRASSAPSSVPLPYSIAEHVDPEEAFVAAISSCHMLTFLYLAAKQRLLIDSYHDHAVGILSRNDRGCLAVTEVRLAPAVIVSGTTVPDEPLIERLHHAAHGECYIANSVMTQISVVATWKYVGT